MSKLNLKAIILCAAASAAVLSATVAAPSLAQQRPAQSFAHIGSDIAVDPTVTYGVLPNGLRYAIQKNGQPAGQVAFRLHINAGSAHEAQGQHGLAHFVEHMPFNGTTHVKEEELQKMLERLGAAFGADTNAMTGQLETIYMFNVPHSGAESVDTALMLFREVASEITFAPEAIDRERGVILSEARARDSADLHAVGSMFKQAFGDHPLARLPIGDLETIRTAPPAQFRAFYDAWYRPENATLVIVGDIDPVAIEAKIKAKFSDWKGRGVAGKPLPAFSAPKVASTRIHVETGATPQVGVSWLSPYEPKVENVAAIRERMVDVLALSILNRRLADQVQTGKAPFLAASASDEALRGVARIYGFSASGAADPAAAIDALVRTQRQATEFGIRQDELDRALVSTRAVLRAQAASAPTRRTAMIVDSLMMQIVQGQAVQSPQQRLQMFEQVARSVTVAEVNAALKRKAGAGEPQIFVQDAKAVPGGEAALQQAYATARSAPLTALAAADAKTWSYTDFGAPGVVAERREVADLGLTMVRFANGVRLTVKPTTFDKDQVQVRVLFGGGQLDLPKDSISPTRMLNAAFIGGGLNRLTVQERQKALAGKSANVVASVAEGGYLLSGDPRQEDFALQMQMMAAYMTDAAWAPPTFEQQKTASAIAVVSAEANPMALLGVKTGAAMRGGDQRFATPSESFYRAVDVAQVKAAVASAIAEADMEVVIVGDITVEEAIAQTAKTLGALPKRKARGDTAAARQVAFTPTKAPLQFTHKGAPEQSMVTVAWGTQSHWASPEAGDQLRILHVIMVDRVRAEMREKQGATYFVAGDSAPSRVFDYGTFTLHSEVRPENVQTFYDTVDRVVRDLQTSEVSQDELDRAIRPRREAMNRTFQTNGYWSTFLLGAQTNEARIEDFRRNDRLYQTVTPASIKAAAKTWLSPDEAFRASIVAESVQANSLAAK